MTASRPTTIQAPEPCPALGEHAINGDPDILAVERAIGELRRGRVLGVSEQQRVRLVAAVETLHADTFARFVTAAGGDIRLALSAERCRALGLSQLTTEAMTLALPGEIDLDRLRALSGLDATNGLPAVTARASPASITERAMVALTAQMPLIPAVVVAGETHVGGDPSLLVVSLAAVAHYQRRCGKQLSIASRARVPLSGEEHCELVLFRDAHADREHLAILVGDLPAERPVPVRLHSACLTGDILGSLRCDCGDQLRGAVRRIAESGGGALLYLAQEGRGIGLANKLRAYALQDDGLDTFDADQQLGFGPDQRDFGEAAAMLHELGISRIQLLTNNPHKIEALREAGIEVVGRESLNGDRNPHNSRYLHAKQTRAGHLVDRTVDTATR